jgi:hypothetical protein
MKSQRVRAGAARLALLIGLSLVASAVQAPTATAGRERPKHVSAADQKAIEELFKGVDPKKYRLQFQNGKRVLGTKKVAMRDLEQVKKYRNPAEAAGWIVLIVETEGQNVIYVLAVGSDELTSVLGKAKAAKLKQIMAKYAL